MTTPAIELLSKIENKSACVGVVGMGYVGLPLAVAVFEAGYEVLGFDVDPKKIEYLNNGVPYLKHLGDDFSKDISAHPFGNSNSCSLMQIPKPHASRLVYFHTLPQTFHRTLLCHLSD